jgi:hypothetical protein
MVQDAECALCTRLWHLLQCLMFVGGRTPAPAPVLLVPHVYPLIVCGGGVEGGRREVSVDGGVVVELGTCHDRK